MRVAVVVGELLGWMFNKLVTVQLSARRKGWERG